MNALLMLNPERIITVWFLDWARHSSDDSELETRSIESGNSHGLAKRADPSSLGLCGVSWYYYQFFLASETEREVMSHQWNNDWTSLWHKFRPWKSYWWTVRSISQLLHFSFFMFLFHFILTSQRNPKEFQKEGLGPCRLTRVWAMETFLKERVFGEKWSAPPSTIHS